MSTDSTIPFIRSPLRRSAIAEFEQRARDWWQDRFREPRRRVTMNVLRYSGGGLALAAGLAAFFMLYNPPPDYLNDPMDDIFDYTLLEDDFNRLPVEEWLKLIGQLVQRLRNMDAGDSMLMASFAAGIAGAARQQLEENTSRLAVDVWDKYARDYDKVPPENREQFLEQTFVDFTKMMEGIAGEPRDISDADRINEVRKQASEDRQALREAPPERQPPSQILGRAFEYMNNNVGSHANPQQKVRGQQMMRDMVRHFRGQDISTGQPRSGPG